MVSKSIARQSVPKTALPDFTPVPRKQPRHDGWTPERQRYFIAALADTGCVAIAARMVNMSKDGVYQLRRQPGAESFRAAWDAAQTLGIQVCKDEAFDRALNGELIPVFVAGKLMGFRRKKNDRLLMFILRHYGQDANGRKTTINYFSTRATAGAATQNPPRNGEGDHAQHGGGAAAAEASTTTVKTVISGSPAPNPQSRDTEAANAITAFEGVELDAEAQAEIHRSLEACAERRRALEAAPGEDPECCYIGVEETNGYLGQLEGGVEDDWVEYKPEGEHSWEGLGEGGSAAEVDRVVGEMKERLAKETPEEREARQVAEDAMARAQWEKSNKPLPGYLGHSALPAPEPQADDPMLDWRNWQGGTYTDPSDPPLNDCGAGLPPAIQALSGGQNDLAMGDHMEHGGGVDAPAETGPKSRKPYKPRTPKPRFTPPDEKRKAKVITAVAEDRREAASAEAERRKRRNKPTKLP